MGLTISISRIDVDPDRIASSIENSSAIGIFAATSWHRLYEQYVPMETGVLQGSVAISPWEIKHTAVYARYQYYGQVYGPNYPIFQGGVAVGFFSPPGQRKHPTGRSMVYSHSHHPKASAKWDQAAKATQMSTLCAEIQAYIESHGIR